ncbi:MAG TPA: hypothetical protein VGC41_01890 [Kofleriaceae bacterium]
MHRWVIALALMLSTGARAEPDHVVVDVRGTLSFEPGHGYYIEVKTAPRVWLLVTEDKVLVRQLQSLTTKPIVVKGALHQMGANENAALPSRALYLDNFTVAPGL